MTPQPADNGKRQAHIASVGLAAPPFSMSQVQSGEHLIARFKDRMSSRSLSLMKKLFSHPSIMHRHFAIDDQEAFFSEDPDIRVERFTRWSIDLSAQAILAALTQAGLTTDAVSVLVVNTCTGYICPGISTYLIEKLALSRQVQAYDLVGSGCGGAIPNIQIAESLLGTNGGTAVSVSVEICSATFQMEDDLSLIVSNTLFGDGAAAAVLWERPEGLELISSSSRYVPEDRDAIRYIHKNGQLHNQLATNLPHLIKKAVSQVVGDVLEQRSLEVKDVKYWAIHPGGEKIINMIKGEIGLSETQLRATRAILSEYGNMSSPTVWFVLRELLDKGIEEGEWCLMAAFGAGLSAHAFLLRKSVAE
jgi:predicted naringenin-chalcone synthase